MRLKTVAIDDNTRSILLRSTIVGTRLTLPPEQLERDIYQKVAKAIEAAGGKWNKKERCHIFPRDVRETLGISNDTVSVTNIQQTEQAFYTPPAIAEQVCDLAKLKSGHTILEPSAGTGHLVKAAISRGIFPTFITAVETNPRLAELLKPHCGRVICSDFLTQNGELGKFDRIIMNPPFSRGDDIKHINHAATFLSERGRLVSICLNGPKQRETLKPISSVWIELGSGAFKESGTLVDTAIVVIAKPF